MADPYGKIQVGAYDKLGELFIEWAKDKTKWPADLDAFHEATKGFVAFPYPDYITKLEIVQRGKEVLFLRLPPKELIEDTIANMNDAGAYPLPGAIYQNKVITNLPNSNLHFLKFRVGDYVIAHCT